MKFSLQSTFSGLLILLSSCSQPLAVSINNQAVYDPSGRLIASEVIDADLQGCINLAMQQQGLDDATELTVLSCSNSEIGNLENIDQLVRLRFLDLSNNNISNLTPLEELPNVTGISLINNRINDISPLFNVRSLTSVSLLGNDAIPCDQLDQLREIIGDNLNGPETCRN